MRQGRKPKSKDDKAYLNQDIFTTYEMAHLCRVNIASIKNWISKGYLRAYRTPGGHYRIQKRELVNFLRRYHMPNPFTGDSLRLYVYSPDVKTAEKLAKKLTGDHECFGFREPGELFLAVGDELPDALLVDVDAFEGEELAAFMGSFAGNARFEGIKLVALVAKDEPVEGFGAVVKKSAKLETIVGEVDQLV